MKEGYGLKFRWKDYGLKFPYELKLTDETDATFIPFDISPDHP